MIPWQISLATLNQINADLGIPTGSFAVAVFVFLIENAGVILHHLSSRLSSFLVNKIYDLSIYLSAADR